MNCRGLLPFHELQSDRGLENFGGIVMRAKAPFDPIEWSRFDLWGLQRSPGTGVLGLPATVGSRQIV